MRQITFWAILFTTTITIFSQTNFIKNNYSVKKVSIPPIFYSDKTELVAIFENVKKVTELRLISSLSINKVYTENTIIDFIAPNKYFQKSRREKDGEITEIEMLQTAGNVYKKKGKNWVKDNEAFVNPSDNFKAMIMPQFKDERGIVAVDDVFNVSFVGEEVLDNKPVKVFEYYLRGQLPTKGKVWVKDRLPLQFEFGTLSGGLYTVNGKVKYKYGSEIAINFPKVT